MGLQAQQIVKLATQIAKCPGYTSQAGIYLNNCLQTLAQDYDFDVIRKTVNFNFDTSATGNGYVAGCDPISCLPTSCVRTRTVRSI